MHAHVARHHVPPGIVGASCRAEAHACSEALAKMWKWLLEPAEAGKWAAAVLADPPRVLQASPED